MSLILKLSQGFKSLGKASVKSKTASNSATSFSPLGDGAAKFSSVLKPPTQDTVSLTKFKKSTGTSSGASTSTRAIKDPLAPATPPLSPKASAKVKPSSTEQPLASAIKTLRATPGGNGPSRSYISRLFGKKSQSSSSTNLVPSAHNAQASVLVRTGYDPKTGAIRNLSIPGAQEEYVRVPLSSLTKKKTLSFSRNESGAESRYNGSYADGYGGW